MNILKKINWNLFFSNAITFIHMQAFLTLICLPILICWGLPLSILTPLGNIIFSPFLTLFLLLSSLIFFCELLYLPNGLFIWLLDKLSTFWTLILSWKQKWVLVGFSKPSLAILIAIPLLAFLIMHYRPTHPKKRSAFLLTLLIGLLCIGLKRHDRAHPPLISIARRQGALTLARAGNEYLLIDPGYVGHAASASSWVSYTLVPEIIKNTGTLTIDHLVVLQLNSVTLEALSILCTKLTVKNLYVPWWTGILKGASWYHYKQLSAIAKLNNTNVIRLNDQLVPIIQTDNFLVTAKPTGKRINYKKISYPAYFIEGAIDNNSFTIYAAKHTKMKRIS